MSWRHARTRSQISGRPDPEVKRQAKSLLENSCGLWLCCGWLSGIAALRRYHELPHERTIWRQIEIAGVPEGMFSIDQ